VKKAAVSAKKAAVSAKKATAPGEQPTETSRMAEVYASRHDSLLAKYRELTVKHEALVRKLKLRTEERLSTYRLSVWALKTSTSAFALLREGVVLLATSHWHALSHGGPWQPVDKPQAPGLRTLRLVGDAMAQRLLAAGRLAAAIVERYQEQGKERILEVRAEYITGDRKPVDLRTVLVVAHDVTQQARSERELAQAQAALLEQEHLRALGEMASGVAHDLNNTLNAMKLRLELLQRSEATPGQYGHLDALARIVADASTRVQRLQDFARQRAEPTNEQSHLEEVIAEAVEIARSDIDHRAAREGTSIHLEVELARLPPVNVSATDLRYVFINLLLNARDAMPHGGTIRVRGRREEGKALITVEDDGTGIPEQHLRSLFRPFFTTKGKHGTGLGLSMAYGVLSRAGGSITAANRPKGGAIFTLTFPLPEQPGSP
jgi:signal transduction histidine kinase